MAPPRSFFIAGTMQGSRLGAALVDQGYRAELQRIITRHYANAVIHCPLNIMQQRFANKLESLYCEHATLIGAETINPIEASPLLQETFSVFHELLKLVADSDVLIACLPNHEPSMGTAMEMLRAHQKGKPVITISSMKQNLAILATSTIIIPDSIHLDSLLASGWLERHAVG